MAGDIKSNPEFKALAAEVERLADHGAGLQPRERSAAIDAEAARISSKLDAIRRRLGHPVDGGDTSGHLFDPMSALLMRLQSIEHYYRQPHAAAVADDADADTAKGAARELARRRRA